MKKILLILTLLIISVSIAVSADGKDKQTDDVANTGMNPIPPPPGHKENETSSGIELEKNKTKELKGTENETEKGKDKGNKTKGEDWENKTKIPEVNETLGEEHGKRGYPPGLNQSITRGQPSNASIEVRIRNIERIREKFQEIEQINATEKPGLRIGQYVQNLEDISDLVGNESIGMKVSEIARNINKSLENGRKAEGRIKSRNFIVRFLFGGDKNSAREIESEISKNQEMINELRIIENSSDADINQVLEDHISLLEEENARLLSVSRSEIRAVGLFSWLF